MQDHLQQIKITGRNGHKEVTTHDLGARREVAGRHRWRNLSRDIRSVEYHPTQSGIALLQLS